MPTLMNPFLRSLSFLRSSSSDLPRGVVFALLITIVVVGTTPAQPILPTVTASETWPVVYADPLPNLTAFQPPGWSDKIVVAKITGTTADTGLILPTNALYVDWSVINSGSAATAARFHTALYVNDVLRATWFTDPPFGPGFYAYVTDYPIGTLPAGVHTIKIRNDTAGTILESNEADNEYSKTIVVKAPVPDIRISPLKLAFAETSNTTSSAAVLQIPQQGVFEKGVRLRTGTLGVQDADSVTSGGGSGPASSSTARHVLIQFRSLPTTQEKAGLLERGLSPLRYLGNGAFWFAVAPGASTAASSIREGAGVHLVVASTSVSKLAPETRLEQFPQVSVQADGNVNVEVMFFSDVPRAEAFSTVGRAGGVIESFTSEHIARVALPYSQLSVLAEADEVEWVQPAPGPKGEYNAVSAQHIHVTELRNPPYDLNGAGVKVGVWDGGSVGTHSDFGQRLTLMDPGSAAADHATHVAGTIGGSGTSDISAKGMATAALLFSYDWNNDSSEMRAGAATGIRLSNHSYGYLTGWEWDGSQWVDYGAAGFGVYGNTASDWDDVVYDTGIIAFKAAGNDRNDGPDNPVGPRMDGPYDCIDESGTGKNMITVGATTDTDGMTGFSSWGPVNDGRVKPDLCANGESLHSTLPGNNYGWMSGTSMATPSACGAGVLLVELYNRLYAAQLRADTCKALLVHGATDLGRTGPDYEFGWGLINARASTDLLQSRSFRLGSVVHGEIQTYSVVVAANSPAIKATLVWTDPAGSPAAPLALVNNLNLYLTSPTGSKMLPWVLDRTNPSNPATRGTNKVDNVEQVVVNLPEPGEWTITVEGAEVPLGPQNFTLVCEQLPAVGTASEFAIYNDGGTDLTVTGIALDAPASYINWSPAAPFVIAPGGSRTVTVTVNTNAAPGGTTTRRLIVASNDADENPYPDGVYIEISKPYPPRTLVKSVTPGTLRNDFSGFVGMRFEVGPAPLVVTELGRMMSAGNTGSHLVKLVDAATGSDVSGASVSISMSGGIAGNFTYASLGAPVTLQSGMSYYLVSREEAGQDLWQDVNATLKTSGAARILGGIYNWATPPWYQYGGIGHCYVPLDFKHANTAVPRILSVEAGGTTSSVTISLAPADNDGAQGGSTPFNSTFDSGITVTASAPEASSGAVFQKWQLDGFDTSTAPVFSFAITTNHTLRAVYAKACETPLVTSRTLGTTRNDYGAYVGMRLQVGTEPIKVTRLGRMMAPGNTSTHRVKLVHATSGADVPGGTVNLSMMGGTPGQFSYAALPAPVILDASASYYLVSSENYGGDEWYDVNSVVRAGDGVSLQGGVYGSGPGAWYNAGSTNQSFVPVDFMYDAGCKPRKLSVTSVNPSAGANISVSPPDNTSASAGATPFDRWYEHDTLVALTAPASVAGNYFLKWQCDGADASTNTVVSVLMNQDRAMTAIYRVGAEARFVTGTTPGTLRNNYGAFVGMRVALSTEDITVTRLGRMMVTGNTRTHTLKIVDAATGQTIAGSTVSVNMTGGVPGEFKYANLPTPISLKGGATYYFVSSESTAGDFWYDVDTKVATTAAGAVRGGVYGSGPGAWYAYGAAGCGFVPVDFIYGIPSLPAVPFATGQTLGQLRNDYGAFVGMRIDVGSSPITVTELGRMMAPGNTGTHQLKLVLANTGQDLPGGSVTVNMSGGEIGDYRYSALPEPLTLSALGSYYLVSREYLGGDLWHNVDTTLNVAAVASVPGGVYGSGPAAWYHYGSPNQSYVPVNFRFTPALTVITKTSARGAHAVSHKTGARLVTDKLSVGGLPVLNLSGAPGQRYRVEMSPDLLNWVSVAELENETVDLQVEMSSGEAQRFYRLIPAD